MKNLVSILPGFLLVGSLWAQPSTSPVIRPLALDESIRLALDNSAQVRKSKIDRQILERRVKEARSEGFPQISAGVELDYWPLLPTQIMPGEIFSLPDGSYVPVQFGRSWQLGGNITLQQNIINEAARRNLPALRSTRNISDLLIVRSEYEVIFNRRRPVISEFDFAETDFVLHPMLTGVWRIRVEVNTM